MRRSAPQAGEPSGGRETKRGRRLAMERKARKANSPQPLQPSFPRQRIFNGRKRAQPGEGSARSAAEAKRGFPDSPGARLLRLERKVAAAEERWAGCEKNVVEMGSQLEGRLAALGTLMEENGLLQRRLENLENLLKNRNFWILRFPPGSNGETPKVPVTFNDTSVSFNAQEWGNLEEWQKEMFKVVMRSNYEMLVSLDDAISKPTFLSQIERGEDPSAKEAGDLEEEDIPVDPGCSGSSVIVVNAASWGQEDEKEEEDGPGTVFLEVASPDDAISKPEFLCHIEGSDEPSAKDPDDLEESDMPVDPSCSGSSMIIVNAASWGRGDGKEEVAAILALQEDSQGAALLEDSSPDLPSSRDVGSQVKQELEEKPIKEEPLSPGSPTDDESFIPVCIKQEEEEQEEQSMEDQPYLVYFDKMSAKRKRYSVAFKKGIVEASRGKNLTAFCKEKKLDLRMVRRWRAEHDEGNAEQRKGGKSSRQPLFPELETLLCGWIAEQKAKALEVRRADIQAFALAVAPQLEIPPEAFKTLQRWLDGFLQRYERSLKKMDSAAQES
ncbi:zinc finger protein 777-like isoform X4 [Anolis sagrei]|uniref:zinc finger protein 777-like isoform X4 n=1 Tax=Anolis sagrei TaxID=38937 RepID=UPI003520D248